MTLYLESSAFVKLFLDEVGAPDVRELWASNAPAVTSWVTLAETRAALASARRSRRLSRAAATTANRLLTEHWLEVTALTVDEIVARTAGDLVLRHRLRGVDGIHLATALPIRDAGTVFVTFDAQLTRAAREEGFAVLT